MRTATDPRPFPWPLVLSEVVTDPNALLSSFGMRWFPLDGCGVVHNFYHHLWRSTAGTSHSAEVRGSYSATPIPDTVLFRDNAPAVHYLSASSGCVIRKHAANVTNAKVFDAFCRPQFTARRQSSSGREVLDQQSVCAVFIYERGEARWDRHGTAAGTQSQTCSVTASVPSIGSAVTAVGSNQGAPSFARVGVTAGSETCFLLAADMQRACHCVFGDDDSSVP
jgi:hypothetical protein